MIRTTLMTPIVALNVASDFNLMFLLCVFAFFLLSLYSSCGCMLQPIMVVDETHDSTGSFCELLGSSLIGGSTIAEKGTLGTSQVESLIRIFSESLVSFSHSVVTDSRLHFADVPKAKKRINSMMAILIDPSKSEAGGAGAGLAAEIDTLVEYAKASGSSVRIPNEPEQQYADAWACD